MSLFNEIYGCYYQVVSDLLSRAPLPDSEARAIIADKAFQESSLFLSPHIWGDDHWPFFDHADGKLLSRLTHPPQRPLTALERRWLRTILEDERLALFIDDAAYKEMRSRLAKEKPLFPAAHLIHLNAPDGDPVQDDGYRRRFRLILQALAAGTTLHVRYRTATGAPWCDEVLPISFLYSPKEKRFQLYAYRPHAPRPYALLNLARLESVRSGGPWPDERPSLDAFFAAQRAPDPLIFEVRDERNAFYRTAVAFSSYEKTATWDEDTGHLTIRLFYSKDQESRLLTDLLSFGPVLHVHSPEKMVIALRQKLEQQCQLLGL